MIIEFHKESDNKLEVFTILGCLLNTFSYEGTC